jgi:CspA family cold shock protein
MDGKVKWFNERKGYGFIEGEDGNDYFVHHTAIKGGASLYDGDAVTFDPAEGDRGKKAENVEKK